MLTFFSDPYPDELLYSSIARYHKYIGNLNLFNTLEDLFDCKTIVPNIYLASNLDRLCDKLGKEYTSEYIIKNHTIFPYYKPFLPSDRQSKMISQMKNGKCEGIYNMLGSTSGGICNDGTIKYCSECATNDINKYGEAYIHREHQLQGILLCPHHPKELFSYQFNSKNSSKIEYISFDEEFIKFNSLNCKYSDKDLDNLYKISQLAYRLFIYYDMKIDRTIVLDKYERLLFNKGLISKNGRVYQNDLYQELIRFYGQSLLSILECDIDINNDYNWLKVITRKSNRITHPLRHLLFINFLGGDIDEFFNQEVSIIKPFGEGPWPCLNKAAEHYLKDTIYNVDIDYDRKTLSPVGTFKCSCGYVYARRGPDSTKDDTYRIGKTIDFGPVWYNKLTELINKGTLSSRQVAKIMGCDPNTIRKKDKELNINYFSSSKAHESSIREEKIKPNFVPKIDEYKKKVLEVIESNKLMLKHKIKPKIAKEYRYIYTHDKEWLDNLFKDNMINNNLKVSAKIDWNERDKVYLNLVKEKYNEIIARVPFVRATKTIIAKELGLLNVIYNFKVKVPKTITFLEKYQETVEVYKIRKFNSLVKDCEESNTMIQLGKIRKLAGMSLNEYDELKEKYEFII